MTERDRRAVPDRLELAGPHTWRLAERDRFGAGGTRHQPGNVHCTVLVGNTAYRGIRSIKRTSRQEVRTCHAPAHLSLRGTA